MKIKTKTHIVTASAFFAALFFSATSAFAKDTRATSSGTWTASGIGDTVTWNNSAPSDIADTVGLDGNITVSYTSGTISINRFRAGTTGNSQAILNVGGGDTEAKIIFTDSFNASQSAGSNGTINILKNGTVESSTPTGGTIAIGSQAALGNGTMNVSGGKISSNTIFVGSSNQTSFPSVGTLTIDNGGTVTAGNRLSIGHGTVAPAAGKTNLLTVTNGKVSVGHEFSIGRNTRGQADVEADGSVESARIVIGNGGAANGTLNVNGGKVEATSAFNIGVAGTGFVNVKDNGYVSGGTFNIGLSNTGVVTVSTGGNVQQTSGYSFIGVNTAGDGTLTINSGGIVGLQAVVIGENGEGRIDIKSGGYMELRSSVASYIGNQTGSEGTLNVNGGRLEMKNSGGVLVLGSAAGATGTLLVNNGGVVNSLGGMSLVKGSLSLDSTSKISLAGDLAVDGATTVNFVAGADNGFLGISAASLTDSGSALSIIVDLNAFTTTLTQQVEITLITLASAPSDDQFLIAQSSVVGDGSNASIADYGFFWNGSKFMLALSNTTVVPPVPEPATYAVILGMLAALAIFIRRRK